MNTAATLSIDLAAIVANWRALAARAPGTETAAVVKADAYGLGMVPVATALHNAGCMTFIVAHMAEAQALRTALAGHASQPTIYVLHGITGATPHDFTTHTLHPILNSMAEIDVWANAIAGGLPDPGCAVHIDTGMSRLGLPADDYTTFATRPRGFNLTLLLSHFSDSEVARSTHSARQLNDFIKACTMMPGTPASLANSSGIFIEGASFSLNRPGIALYGGNPTPHTTNPMQPVVTLRAPVLQQRIVPAGTPVGYNATFTTARETRLATFALGYADGWLRSGSGKAYAKIAGRLCPLVGRISMDLIIADITEMTELEAAGIKDATLLDETLTIDTVAASMGTISYELLTRLGQRLNRQYLNG